MFNTSEHRHRFELITVTCRACGISAHFLHKTAENDQPDRFIPPEKLTAILLLITPICGFDIAGAWTTSDNHSSFERTNFFVNKCNKSLYWKFYHCFFLFVCFQTFNHILQSFLTLRKDFRRHHKNSEPQHKVNHVKGILHLRKNIRALMLNPWTCSFRISLLKLNIFKQCFFP